VFKSIGGSIRLVEPGVPVLADPTGRVIHIYPRRDGAETAVTESTRTIWIVAALVPGIPVGLGVEAVGKTMEYLSILSWSTCRNISITGYHVAVLLQSSSINTTSLKTMMNHQVTRGNHKVY